MSIAENIQLVNERISAACARAGRDPAEVTLVGISKLKPPDAIVQAISAGLRHIGENRVEEGSSKIPVVEAATEHDINWHMVGHVQSRKAKQVVRHFDLVHSVDSMRLARRLARLAAERDTRLRVLLEINVSGEASKYGFEGYNWYQDAAVRERLWRELAECLELRELCIAGLMTMAPFNADEREVRNVFADLYALRDELQLSLGVALPALSMGMTDDYPIAIEEGATIIRVGRAIFGERGQATPKWKGR